MVVAHAKTIAIATVNTFNDRQPRLHRLKMITSLMRPDLLVHRTQRCRRIITRKALPLMLIEERIHHFFHVLMNIGLHPSRHARHAAPTGAEAHERLHHQPLQILHRQGHAHAVRLPLGNVQQPRIRLAHRGEVRNALVHHGLRHLVPVHLVTIAKIARPPLRLVHLHAMAFVDVYETAVIPRIEAIGFHPVELLQPDLLHPHDETLVELRVRPGAPILLVRPAIAYRSEVWFQHDPVRCRHSPALHRYQHFARQLQARLPLRRLVHFVRYLGPLNKNSLGVRQQKRMQRKLAFRQPHRRGIQSQRSESKQITARDVHKLSLTLLVARPPTAEIDAGELPNRRDSP